MFGFREGKKTPLPTYDKENEIPAVKSSICTGEKTAGFVDKRTGKYRDVVAVKTPADLEEFKKTYGVEEVKTIY